MTTTCNAPFFLDDQKINDGSGVDKATAEQPKASTAELEFDDDDDDDVVDLRAFSTADKVIYMDLFELPPQAKVVKNWIMQHSKSILDSFRHI